MHTSDNIDSESGDRKKPEIITFYNVHKAGVDIVDKLKATYSVSRSSYRWPLTAFFTLLNIAGINIRIIYELNTEKKSVLEDTDRTVD